MFLPVDRSITVSAPHSVAQRSFSTSSSIDERHGGVADVGVDLHQEVAADDHRLELEVVDVGGNDGAAARDLVADELGRQPFADGDELHLGRDLAAARVVELRADVPGRAARRDPRLRAASASPSRDVVPLRTAGVVDAQRRLAAARARSRASARARPAGRRRRPCGSSETRRRSRRRRAACTTGRVVMITQGSIALQCSLLRVVGEANAEAEAAILRAMGVAEPAARAVGAEEPAAAADHFQPGPTTRSGSVTLPSG